MSSFISTMQDEMKLELQQKSLVPGAPLVDVVVVVMVRLALVFLEEWRCNQTNTATSVTRPGLDLTGHKQLEAQAVEIKEVEVFLSTMLRGWNTKQQKLFAMLHHSPPGGQRSQVQDGDSQGPGVW